MELMSTTESLPSKPFLEAPELLDLPEGPVRDDMADIETVIRPTEGWIAVDWNELLRSHELFYTLVMRDVKIRYKQTVLGVAWAVLQPLFTMIDLHGDLRPVRGMPSERRPVPGVRLRRPGALDLLLQRRRPRRA